MSSINIQKSVRSARTTDLQYMLMADAMVAQPLFAANRFVGMHGRENLAAFWQTLTATLNNAGPPKTTAQWQKAWTTLKCTIRTKVAKMRRDRLQTGNTSERMKLSELEEKVLGLMGRVSVEGLNVPDNLPNDDISLLAIMGVDAVDGDELIIEMQQEDEGMVEVLCVPSGSGGVQGEYLNPVVHPSPPTTPHTVDTPPLPQPSTQRPRSRPRFVADSDRLLAQETTRAAFQELMEQQNSVIKNLAETQITSNKLVEKISTFIMDETIRNREEKVKEREEKVREREDRARERERDKEERVREMEERARERERDREERVREMEDRVTERERDREERVTERERDREERAQQFAQLMLVLRILAEKGK